MAELFHITVTDIVPEDVQKRLNATRWTEVPGGPAGR